MEMMEMMDAMEMMFMMFHDDRWMSGRNVRSVMTSSSAAAITSALPSRLYYGDGKRVSLRSLHIT
jgi:hypothetical protein